MSMLTPLGSTKPTKFIDVHPGSKVEVTDTKGGVDTFQALVVEMKPEYGPNGVPALAVKPDGSDELALITDTGKWRIRIILNSTLLADEIPPVGLERLRGKPVEIEGVQFHGGMESATSIIRWAGGKAAINWRQATDQAQEALVIRTLEGDMDASIGDWVLRGTKGEFYPCKPDVKVTKYDTIG